LVAAAKFLVAATKKLFVPNFVAVTKPFFSVIPGSSDISLYSHGLPVLKHPKRTNV